MKTIKLAIMIFVMSAAWALTGCGVKEAVDPVLEKIEDMRPGEKEQEEGTEERNGSGAEKLAESESGAEGLAESESGTEELAESESSTEGLEESESGAEELAASESGAEELAESSPAAADPVTVDPAALAAVPDGPTLMYVVNCDESVTLWGGYEWEEEPPYELVTTDAIMQIPLGAPVYYVRNTFGDLYEVYYQDDSNYGYISEKYLSEIPPEFQNAAFSANMTLYVADCDFSITLYESPSPSAVEIRQIPLGDAVTYLGPASNGFGQVRYQGDTGYALAAHLSPVRGRSLEWRFRNDTDSMNYNLSNHYATVVNCKKSITLRKIPSTSGEEICQIPLGEIVRRIDTPYENDEFASVYYNGYAGYALLSYLEISLGLDHEG